MEGGFPIENGELGVVALRIGPAEVVMARLVKAIDIVPADLEASHSKPGCLHELARLFGALGNNMERKRFLTRVLKLNRDRGDERGVALTSRMLSDTNRSLGLYGEGMKQAREASKIRERLGDIVGQAWCFSDLASLLYDDGQLDAAEEAAFHSIALLSGKGEESLLCQLHDHLGNIYRSKGKRKKATHHLEVALGIATLFNWRSELFWVELSLGKVVSG